MSNVVYVRIKHEILPCPCCGAKAIVGDDNGLEIAIECSKCGLSMYVCNSFGKDYFLECINRWNKRKS